MGETFSDEPLKEASFGFEGLEIFKVEGAALGLTVADLDSDFCLRVQVAVGRKASERWRNGFCSEERARVCVGGV